MQIDLNDILEEPVVLMPHNIMDDLKSYLKKLGLDNCSKPYILDGILEEPVVLMPHNIMEDLDLYKKRLGIDD